MFRLVVPPLVIDTPRVLYDITRLVRSRHRSFATGVDRIDLAIALDLVQRFGERCDFLHIGRFGPVVISRDLGMRMLDLCNSNWNGDGGVEPPSLAWLLRQEEVLRRLSPVPAGIVSADTTYVVASHSGLGKIRGGRRRLDPAALMRQNIYIHDLIPLEMPEYQRPETQVAFAAYLDELAGQPVSFVANSKDTEARLRAYANRKGWPVEGYAVALPRLEYLPEAAPKPPSEQVQAYVNDERPFFTIVGTIEPRKNHLLLLNIWRDLCQSDPSAPRLCVIGKRGWENENIVDMLDRCEVIRGSVQEFANLNDSEVQLLMQRSRALLFPSFIEGLGIPLLEATALGIPCIVSDLPVFREIAPDGTTFLDPLDGLGWKEAIRQKSTTTLACVS